MLLHTASLYHVNAENNSGRHFLDFAQQELKEKKFGVNPKIPREFIPLVPSPKLVASSEAWFQRYHLTA